MTQLPQDCLDQAEKLASSFDVEKIWVNELGKEKVLVSAFKEPLVPAVALLLHQTRLSVVKEVVMAVELAHDEDPEEKTSGECCDGMLAAAKSIEAKYAEGKEGKV